MDVKDFQLKMNAENEKLLTVFNPLPHDFTWNFEGSPYTVHSMENVRLKAPIARIIGKHLIDEYLMGRKNITLEDKDAAKRIIFGDV